MNKILLSDSGPKVSQAVYGFWRWENAESSKMEQTIRLCMDLGINTFDHADYYGGGSAEGMFGDTISKMGINRKDLVLFSKCGLRKTENGKSYIDNSPKYILNSVESSLKSLKTDYIDIFLLDRFDYLSDPEQTAMALAEIVNSGKVNHIGVSNFTVFQHQLLASYLSIPIVTNHIELNLRNITSLKDGRLDFIKQQFSKPLVWSPLAGGEILAGTDGKSAVINTKLGQMAEKYNANIEQMAVAWLAQLGTLPIIGSLSEDRIRNVASGFSFKLSREDWYELYQLSLKG